MSDPIKRIGLDASWTAQSAQNIKTALDRGNYLSAMSNAALMQGAAVADAIWHTGSAVVGYICVFSGDYATPFWHAVRGGAHAIQAAVTSPAILVPKIAVFTTDLLGINSRWEPAPAKQPNRVYIFAQTSMDKLRQLSPGMTGLKVAATVVGAGSVMSSLYLGYNYLRGEANLLEELSLVTHQYKDSIRKAIDQHEKNVNLAMNRHKSSIDNAVSKLNHNIRSINQEIAKSNNGIENLNLKTSELNIGVDRIFGEGPLAEPSSSWLPILSLLGISGAGVYGVSKYVNCSTIGSFIIKNVVPKKKKPIQDEESMLKKSQLDPILDARFRLKDWGKIIGLVAASTLGYGIYSSWGPLSSEISSTFSSFEASETVVSNYRINWDFIGTILSGSTLAAIALKSALSPNAALQGVKKLANNPVTAIRDHKIQSLVGIASAAWLGWKGSSFVWNAVPMSVK